MDLISSTPAPLYMGALPGRDPVPRVTINLCRVAPSTVPRGHVRLHLGLEDSLEAALEPSRVELERFLAAAHLYAREEPTYWHCEQGLNRSGLAVAAYLHLHRGLLISDAILHLRARRGEMVLCNPRFEACLRRWYGQPDEQEFAPNRFQALLRARMGGEG